MGNRYFLFVANEPDPEKEDDYNDWYTGRHIPMMFGFEGMKKASRYRRIGDNNDCSRYLAVYEFESKEALDKFPQSPEFAAAVKDFDEKWQSGGFTSRWGSSYELLKSWEKQQSTEVMD